MDDSIRYQKTEMDEIVRNQIIVSEIGRKVSKTDYSVRNRIKESEIRQDCTKSDQSV